MRGSGIQICAAEPHNLAELLPWHSAAARAAERESPDDRVEERREHEQGKKRERARGEERAGLRERGVR